MHGRGGPWGFGKILFRGVLGVVRKSRVGVLFFAFLCFIAFLWTIFLDITPLPPPMCASMVDNRFGLT